MRGPIGAITSSMGQDVDHQRRAGRLDLPAPNTSDETGPSHKSLICVPMKQQGRPGRAKARQDGMHSSDTAQIFFDEVRVPKRNRIARKQGFYLPDGAFQESGCGRGGLPQGA